MGNGSANSDSLFVKVDGYKVVLQDLEVIKQIIANLRDAISVLNKVAEVKEKSVSMFMENISRLNEKLSSISTQMPMVEGSPAYENDDSESPRTVISGTVGDLRGELESLKSELSSLQ